MHVFLNPACDGERGLKKWSGIALELKNRFGDPQMSQIISTAALIGQLRDLLMRGERLIVAAGGDGTVNWVLNAVYSIPGAIPQVMFGAIGLGSSNDYHKPFVSRMRIKGIPIRLNSERSQWQDIIEIRYQNQRGDLSTRYCINNASLGITAEANALYNANDPVIRGIQRYSIEAAIAVSAVRTIFAYRNLPCRIRIDDRSPFFSRITNLGIIKNPHFAGTLRYELDIGPQDGSLGLCLCRNMSRSQTVRTLVRLYQGRFQDLRGTSSWIASRVAVSSDRCFALEMDGEVVRTGNAEFKVLPKAVRCCR
jgi:diacylglycerol kinase family enzyme